jgi:hypothetical protein
MLPILVAPTAAAEFNTIRPPLLPIACWRLEDMRFDFDSSFVTPESRAELTALAALWRRCNGPPASVFGHADPVGDDDYNKTLSGRRATAVYALLARRVDLWEDLHSKPFGGDTWGTRSVQSMLAATGHDPGPVDGQSGPKTSAAVKNFQAEQGLPADGSVGPATRKKLYAAYMDAICADEAGQPFVLAATDFLGQGLDADGKADYQGCSEFNPLLVFSKEENQRLSAPGQKPLRNAENTPNRRVVVFLFPAGTRVSTTKWPCPRVSEGVADCKSMFWPDGDHRRDFQANRRDYPTTHDTFACRFYDGMARRSPCEVVRKTLSVRLLDSEKLPMPGTPYELDIGGHETRTGSANEDAWLVETDVLAPSVCTIKWASTGVERSHYEISLRLDATTGDDDARAKKRLHNMGYVPISGLEESVRAFQIDYGTSSRDGTLDGETKQRLTDAHDLGIARNE